MVPLLKTASTLIFLNLDNRRDGTRWRHGPRGGRVTHDGDGRRVMVRGHARRRDDMHGMGGGKAVYSQWSACVALGFRPVVNRRAGDRSDYIAGKRWGLAYGTVPAGCSPVKQLLAGGWGGSLPYTHAPRREKVIPPLEIPAESLDSHEFPAGAQPMADGGSAKVAGMHIPEAVCQNQSVNFGVMAGHIDGSQPGDGPVRQKSIGGKIRILARIQSPDVVVRQYAHMAQLKKGNGRVIKGMIGFGIGYKHSALIFRIVIFNRHAVDESPWLTTTDCRIGKG